VNSACTVVVYFDRYPSQRVNVYCTCELMSGQFSPVVTNETRVHREDSLTALVQLLQLTACTDQATEAHVMF